MSAKNEQNSTNQKQNSSQGKKKIVAEVELDAEFVDNMQDNGSSDNFDDPIEPDPYYDIEEHEDHVHEYDG